MNDRVFRNRLGNKVAVLVIIGIGLLTGIVLSADWVVNTDRTHEWLVQKVETIIGGQFGFHRAGISLLPLPALTLHKVWFDVPRAATGRIGEMKLRPDLLSTVLGKPRLAAVHLHRPSVRLQIQPGQKKILKDIDLNSFLAKVSSGIPAEAYPVADIKIRVDNGSLLFSEGYRIRDKFEIIAMQAELSREGFLQLNLESTTAIAKEIKLKLALDVASMKGQGRLQVKGFDLQLVSEQIEPAWKEIATGKLDLDIRGTSQGTGRISIRSEVAADRFVLGQGLSSCPVKELQAVVSASLNDGKLKIDIEALKTAAPGLDLAGIIISGFDQKFANPEISARAKKIEIAGIYRILLATIGPNELLREFSSLMKDGWILDLELGCRAADWHDLFSWKNLKIKGKASECSLLLPSLNWDLDDINGNFAIENGRLKGKNLTARWGDTVARDGILELALVDTSQMDFSLLCALEANLVQIPGVLKEFVETEGFLEELQRVRIIEGRASGNLEIRQAEGDWHVLLRADELSCQVGYELLPDTLLIEKGQVVYNDNSLEFGQITGSLGQNSFTGLAGRLDWSGKTWININKGSLRVNCNDFFVWKIPLFRDLASDFDIRKFEGWIDVSALRLGGPLLEPGKWEFNLEAGTEQLVLDSQLLPGPLNITRAELVVDQAKLAVNSLSLEAMGTALELAGEVSDLQSGTPKAKLALNGKVGLKLGNWLKSRFKLPDRLRIDQGLKLNRLNLEIQNGQFEVNVEAGLAGDVVLELEAAASRSGFDVRRLFVKDSTSKALVKVCHQFNSYDWKVGFNGNLTRDTLDKLWRLQKDYAGELIGRGRLVLNFENLQASTLSGDLEFFKVALPLGHYGCLQVPQAHVSGTKGGIAINNANILWQGDSFEIDGRIVFKPDALYLDLDTKAAVVHADRILKLVSEPSTPADKSKPAPHPLYKIKGIVAFKFDRLLYENYNLEPVEAMAIVDGSKVSIRLVNAKVCGISVAGGINWSPGQLSLNLNPSIARTKLKYTLGCLVGEDTSERIDAEMAVNGWITTNGSSQEQLFKNLKGLIKIDMTQGRISNLGRAGLFTNLIAYLKLNRLVTGDIPDLRSRDLPFKSIEARLAFKGSYILLEQARIRAETINIVGEGKMNVVDRKVDLTMLVSPIKSLDWIISHTPIVGKILKGTLVAIPVGISGSINDPTVIPLSPKAIGTRVLGILERTLKAPFELIQPILPKTPPGADTQSVEDRDGYGH